MQSSASRCVESLRRSKQHPFRCEYFLVSDLHDILAFDICMNDYGMYQLARGSGRRAHWPYAIELPNESDCDSGA